ncbi:hypothetical protein HY411_03100 [Candidatus Gottesmanbacteria bacterium]|nr:hypothetical protein [Candidatus Gottesmanbacteria bacterium]
MEFVAVLAVAVGVALLNSFHVIVQWLNNKPGEMFTGIAHSFADYFLYTTHMAQGAAGRWVYADQLFTNETLAPTWYYWFNVTLGHLGSLVGLSPFATYNVSLVFLVVVLCLVWYYLAKTLYPTNRFLRLTSWIMILTTTSFFSPVPSGTGLDFLHVELLGQFWFSPSPIFNRLGGVPYQVFQTILFVLLAIVFSRSLTMESTLRITKHELRSMGKAFFSSFIIHNSLFIILLAFFAAIANPVQMVLFVAAATVTTAYVFTHHKNFNVSIHQHIVALGAVAVTGAFGAWMANQEFARQPVFVAARAWELAQWVPNSLPILLLSMGPILFFVPFGIRKVFTKGDTLRILLISYGLISFSLFLSGVPRLLQLSPVRFLHPVPYAAALTLLAVEGFFQLSGMLKRVFRNEAPRAHARGIFKFFGERNPPKHYPTTLKLRGVSARSHSSTGLHPWSSAKADKISLYTMHALLLALYLIFTVPAMYRQLMDRTTPARNPQLLMDTVYNHVPAPIVEALTWLKRQPQTVPPAARSPASRGESVVVLVDPQIPIEVLVPVFTGKISFTGHPIHTLYPDVKETLRQQFFTGLMSSPQMFLSDHRIGYIIAAPTRVLPPLVLSLVTQVYKNTSVTIYKL